MAERPSHEREHRRPDDEERNAVRREWELVLWPMYEEAFRHRGHWRTRTREAVDSVTNWVKQREMSHVFPPDPFPYMDSDHRLPTGDDLPWMYLVVGMKLEEFFGFRRVFIEEQAWRDLGSHYHLLERSVWGIVHRAARLKDYVIWWAFIKEDLLAADAEPGSESPPSPAKDSTPSRGKETEGLGHTNTPNRPEGVGRMTLAGFIQAYCKGPLTDHRIESLKSSLQAAARNGKVVLPPCICTGGGQWTKGKAKYYSVTSLIEKWSDYQKELPALPGLK